MLRSTGRIGARIGTLAGLSLLLATLTPALPAAAGARTPVAHARAASRALPQPTAGP